MHSGASSAGTWLWKLEGTTWTEVLKLSDPHRRQSRRQSHLDNVAHILLYAGTNTELVSVEYSGGTYQLWTSRPAASPISLSGSEIATIDIDFNRPHVACHRKRCHRSDRCLLQRLALFHLERVRSLSLRA